MYLQDRALGWPLKRFTAREQCVGALQGLTSIGRSGKELSSSKANPEATASLECVCGLRTDGDQF